MPELTRFSPISLSCPERVSRTLRQHLFCGIRFEITPPLDSLQNKHSVTQFVI
jgi:hypothetical protein